MDAKYQKEKVVNGTKITQNKDIKVSQSTIDTIKKMGMTAALEAAANSTKAMQPDKKGSGYSSADNQNFLEGVRRMYGDTRYQNALNKVGGKTFTFKPLGDI